MHKAKKVERAGHQQGECWQYRGGFIERWPPHPGARGNWSWKVCGASGWVSNKEQAKDKIDHILRLAKAILDAEAAAQ